MTNPLGSFIWYELMTTDADAAAAFYSAVVDWTIEHETNASGDEIDYRHIMRADGHGQPGRDLAAGGGNAGYQASA